MFSYPPLPRLILPFGIGIAAYLIFGLEISRLLLWLYYLLLLSAWAMVRPLALNRYSLRWVFGCWVSLMLLGGGYSLAMQHNQLHRRGHFSGFDQAGGGVLVQVAEPAIEKPNSFQVIVRVRKLFGDSLSGPVHGRLMLYLEKDSLAAGIRYGDRLLLPNRHDALLSPANPAAFNYSSYLARSNIYHSAYIRSGQWKHLHENKGFFLLRWALNLRGHAVKVLADRQMPERDFAVISALLLGQRDLLDEELRREFAGAGAMHILCVSGLHVGIIFLVLKTLLPFSDRRPWGRLLQTLAVISGIWLYAAVTGFSPSVLRASTMFTFVALGRGLGRASDIYNTLAASAFVLLLVNPFLLSRIGFQLSYLAVFGIVSLHPWMSHRLPASSSLLRKGRDILLISVAAQLSTAPLAIHYFHQFPNYFLLTNLVAIPLAGVIIHAGLLTLALSPIPLAGELAGRMLSLLTGMLHRSVRLIEGLPWATTSELYVTPAETLLIYLILFCGLSYLMRGRRPQLMAALCLALLLSVCVSWRSLQNHRQQDFVVYAIDRVTAIDFFTGRQAVMLACAQGRSDARQQGFHLQGNRLRRGAGRSILELALEKDTTAFLDHWARQGAYVRFGAVGLLLISEDLGPVINQRSASFSLRESLLPDAGIQNGAMNPDTLPVVEYLIIVQNPRLDLPWLLGRIRPGRVVVDASNSKWNAQRWVDACLEAGVEVWCVRSRGAYVSSGQKRSRN